MSLTLEKPPLQKTLYPCQHEAYTLFLNLLRLGKSTLDPSDVGTGKTVVAVKLAAALIAEGRQVFVVCPKSVIPMWYREFAAEGIKPLGVLNYEMLRGGRTKWVSKKFKRVITWHLPAGAVVFFDEVHNCKGAATQNSQLLIAAVHQGYAVHGMSATAAEDPTEMRALGYALGLHSLNSTDDPNKLVPWMRWMRRHGCIQDPWRNWKVGRREHIAPIKKLLYEGADARAHRLTVAQFPDSFRENRVFVEALDFGDKSAIHEAYAENGITPQIVEAFIENGTVGGNDCVLVDLLRARQLAESYKLPLISAMVEELVGEGHSVPVFLNFRESIQYLQQSLAHLNPQVVQGGQTMAERDAAISSFQADGTRVLLINVAAGGTGVSLHDLNGLHPRVSLISPSFNAKQHLQTLGRIHRNGAKTDAVQKILIAAGTVEEAVMIAIERKITNLNTIL
jgi:SNF2 family DNA or RNA helicase